jgi:hypothetical protein
VAAPPQPAVEPALALPSAASAPALPSAQVPSLQLPSEVMVKEPVVSAAPAANAEQGVNITEQGVSITEDQQSNHPLLASNLGYPAQVVQVGSSIGDPAQQQQAIAITTTAEEEDITHLAGHLVSPQGQGLPGAAAHIDHLLLKEGRHPDQQGIPIPASAVTSPEPAITTTMIKGADTATGTPLRNAMRAAELASGTADGPLQRAGMGALDAAQTAGGGAQVVMAPAELISAQQNGPAQHNLAASQQGPSRVVAQEMTGNDLGMMLTQAQPDAAAATGPPLQVFMASTPGKEAGQQQQQQQEGGLGPKQPGQTQPLGAAVGELHATAMPDNTHKTHASPAPVMPAAAAAAAGRGSHAAVMVQTPGSHNTRSRARAGPSRFASTPVCNGSNAAVADTVQADVAATPASHRVSGRSRRAGLQTPGPVTTEAAVAPPSAAAQGAPAQEGSGAAPACQDRAGQGGDHPHRQVSGEASLRLEPGVAAATQNPDAASPQQRITTSGAEHSSGGAHTRSGQSKQKSGQVEQQVLGTGVSVQGVHEVLVPPPPASDLGPSDQALSPAPASLPEQAPSGEQQLCGEAMHGGESWSDCSLGDLPSIGNHVSNQRPY